MNSWARSRWGQPAYPGLLGSNKKLWRTSLGLSHLRGEWLEYLSPESKLLVESLTPQYFWSSSAYSQKQPSGERERARAHGPQEAAFVCLRSARTEEIWWPPAQGLESQGLEPDCLHANLIESAAFESNSGQCYWKGSDYFSSTCFKFPKRDLENLKKIQPICWVSNRIITNHALVTHYVLAFLYGSGQGFLSLGLVSITPASSSIKTINRKCCTLLQNPVAPQVLFQDKAKNRCHHLQNPAMLPSGNDKFTLNPGDAVLHGVSFPIMQVRESLTFLLPRTPPPSVFYLSIFMILAQFWWHLAKVAIVLLLNIQFLLGPFPYDPHSWDSREIITLWLY